MPRSAPPIQRRPTERATAWAVTGPLGHLYSVSADIVVLWTRWLAARGRGRPFGG
ncbi:MAG: hypothetical protein WD844_13300 [Thermoleophilaceae bacterium]